MRWAFAPTIVPVPNATMSKIWVAPFGLVASLVAIALVVTSFPQLVDVFHLAYQTGWYGVYDAIGGFAADTAVIFTTAAVLLVRRGAGLRLGIALVAFIPFPLAALAAMPCFAVAHPSALCGVWSPALSRPPGIAPFS